VPLLYYFLFRRTPTIGLQAPKVKKNKKTVTFFHNIHIAASPLSSQCPKWLKKRNFEKANGSINPFFPEL